MSQAVPATSLQLSVVIPVYRAEKSLNQLYQRIVSVLEKEKIIFEIIFIEDCGGDSSWDIIVELAQWDPRVQGMQLSRNYGQHNALLCGIRAAEGDLIVTMDDDLQHPPEEIPKLIAALEKELDVIYGSPEKEQHGLLRDLASQITKATLQHAMGAKSASHISAFRCFRKRLRDAFTTFDGPHPNIDVFLTWATNKFSYTTVNHNQRKLGESGYNAKKLFFHAVNMITGFSTLPLRIASVLGLLISFFGGLLLLYIIISYFIHDTPVQGFAFISSIITIFSGAQLLSLGIIGEYLGVLHSQSKGSPSFLTLNKTKCE